MGWFFYFRLLMEKHAQYNRFIFVHFLTFTSTLLYSVIWNQSLEMWLIQTLLCPFLLFISSSVVPYSYRSINHGEYQDIYPSRPVKFCLNNISYNTCNCNFLFPSSVKLTQFSPWNSRKYNSITYHWFREAVAAGTIRGANQDTENILSDLFTKVSTKSRRVFI